MVPPTSEVKPKSDEIPLHWNILDPRFFSDQITDEVIEDYTALVIELLGSKSVLKFTESMKFGMTKLLNLVYSNYDEEYPTIKTVLDFLEEIEGITDGTRKSLYRRLGNFSSGSQGNIFCKPTSFDPGLLLSTPVCIKMRHLSEDFPSAVSLLTYFLLRQAVSYFKKQGEVQGTKPVRHVTIIDEAPQVIGEHKTIRLYVEKILEEMRKYGEGLVLVGRNSSIGKVILRETNQKIAHRVAADDINNVGKLVGIKKTHEQELIGRLPRGVAFVRAGTQPAFPVKIYR